MLRANLAKADAEVAELTAEHDEIQAALADLAAEPDRFVEAQNKLRELEVIRPSKQRTADAIRQAIPIAEGRERRERIAVEIDEAKRNSAKLQRGLEARYTKAAEAFAEVCRDIQADVDRLRHLKAVADTANPRLPVPFRSAEMTLRYDKFAGSNGLKGLTEGLTVRAWDGSTLFAS
jgi:hypothetical protein